MGPQKPYSFTDLSKKINRPSITIVAVILGVWLGYMQFPFLKYLRPVGDFYVALLQICVLPFLMATIPLAVRSALTSGTAGNVMGRLIGWLITTTVMVMLIAVLVPLVLFHFVPMDQNIAHRIGAMFGGSGTHVDMEFALSPQLASDEGDKQETGLMAIIPVNVFSALSSNNSLQVIVFLFLFGVGMVLSERRSGTSVFSALRHIQSVCILIFDWFNLLIPIGIITLIAPQIALLGPDAFAVLAPFASAFLVTSIMLIALPIFCMSLSLRVPPREVLAVFMKPLALVAATRNALICVPTALETMTDELHAPKQPCELFIPIGFAIVRFGNLTHFIVAAVFIGNLTGHTFSGTELLLVAVFSFMSSFATIGLAGLPGLVPLAAVLRPFGLSYELALPLMIIADPIVSMIRGMLNVALNCQIPALAGAGGRKPIAVPAVVKIA
jgi:proton glutamate symport protein